MLQIQVVFANILDDFLDVVVDFILNIYEEDLKYLLLQVNVHLA